MKPLERLLIPGLMIAFATVASAQTLGGLSGSALDPKLMKMAEAVVGEAANQPGTNRIDPGQIAVTLVDPSNPSMVRWGSHRGTEPIYPASVVKLFHLAAAHRWMEDGRLAETDELRRAMHDMIVDSSNEATHYVLDLLTGTTSGPELTPDALRMWQDQRNAVNRFFWSLGYTNINCSKKPWCEGPYGRETQAIQAFEPRRNLLTTDATARLLAEIALDRMVSPARCAQMRALLSRDPAVPPAPGDQIRGFVGSGLGAGMRLWSKAGGTSQTRHDAALVELPDGRRVILVVFTEGHAGDESLIPRLTRSVLGAW